MRLRTLVIIALSTAIGFAAPKQRAWEDGSLLDNRDNPYFTGKDAATVDGTKSNTYATNDSFNVSQNAGPNTVYDHYVIEGRSAAYLVEFAHLKDYPAARVTVRKAIRFAVEKSKLWFLDDNGREYETAIVKTVPRQGAALVTQVQPPAPAPAPKPAPKPEPVVAKAEVKEVPVVVKQPPKPEPPSGEAGANSGGRGYCVRQ